MKRIVPAALALTALSVCTLVTKGAQASPWTLPEGTVSLETSFDFQTANREFLISGENYEYSLDGVFYSSNLRGGVRYGITDRFEIGGQLSFSYVGYNADEGYLGDGVLVPLPQGQDTADRQQTAQNILSLDQNAFGLGDLRLFIRNRLTPFGPVVVATEIAVKLPTGYAPPSGTFRDDEFTEGTQDDVTLGDGQMDIQPMLLLGFVPARDWFIRLDAGLNLRLFGPGQQVVGAFKTGYRASPSVLPYIFVNGQHSFTEGETVGISYTTDAPGTPADEFTADLLVPTDYRLDRSAVQPGVGAILAFGEKNLDVSYSYTVWGINIAQLHIFSIGTTFTL